MKPQRNTDEHRDSRAATKLICLAFLCVLRVLAVKALSGINREDAKSAKNPRRRILSKRQRICTLVVQIRPAVVQICVHLWFHSCLWLRLEQAGNFIYFEAGQFCGPAS